MKEWIYKKSNAPKSLYDKLRGDSNQIIVKNRAQGQTLYWYQPVSHSYFI